MGKNIIMLILAFAPLASNAQSDKFLADYDLALYLHRGDRFIPPAMERFVREDAITYYPWLYGPAYLMSPDSDPLAPTYRFGRDGDAYYFVLSLKDTGCFPAADIKSAPFLNALDSDGSVHTLRIDSVTPLIESLWYYVNSNGGPRMQTVIPDETTEYESRSGVTSSYTLAQYHLDIVFRIDDIDAFMKLRPLKFDFLGGQYVYDFTDNPKFIRRFARGMRQSKKRLDKAYDRYQKGARAVFQ